MHVYITKYIVALHWILSEEPKSEETEIYYIEDLLMSETYIIVEEHRTGLRKHYLSREDYGGSIHVNWSERKRFVGSYKEAYNFGKVIGANKRKRYSTPQHPQKICSIFSLLSTTSKIKYMWHVFYYISIALYNFTL